MTTEQRKAIKILNELKSLNNLCDDDYFLILSFIVDGCKSDITYIPFSPCPQFPTLFGDVTCSINNNENKESL